MFSRVAAQVKQIEILSEKVAELELKMSKTIPDYTIIGKPDADGTYELSRVVEFARFACVMHDEKGINWQSCGLGIPKFIEYSLDYKIYHREYPGDYCELERPVKAKYIRAPEWTGYNVIVLYNSASASYYADDADDAKSIRDDSDELYNRYKVRFVHDNSVTSPFMSRQNSPQ